MDQQLSKFETEISAQSGAPKWLEWVDVFKGIAILSVVLHHVCGHLMAWNPVGSNTWLIFAWASQPLRFAVPGFLMLSTILLVSSYSRRPQILLYFQKRMSGLVYPYIFWSIFYLLFLYGMHDIRFSPEVILQKLLWGKSYFHLYFLVISIQLMMIIPFLTWVGKRVSSGIFYGILITILPLGVYWLNRLVWHIHYPGSVVLWYLPSVLIGLWFAQSLSSIKGKIDRFVWIWLLLGFVSSATFFVLNVKDLAGIKVDHFLFQESNWFFALSFPVLVLRLAMLLQGSILGRSLQALGAYSMQIYLLHPVVIRVLGHFPELKLLSPFVVFILYAVLSAGLPFLVAMVLDRLKISPLMFGR